MGETEEKESWWYDTRWGRFLYWGTLVATLAGVVASVSIASFQLPPVIYLYGFLGATVYAFTSFAKQFDKDDRYRLKILSRTAAVLPLAAGVYLLSFSFPDLTGNVTALKINSTNGDVSESDRIVAGVVFLAGIYVSATLKAIGGLAERLLGVSTEDQQPNATDERDEGETGPEGNTDEDSRREESNQSEG